MNLCDIDVIKRRIWTKLKRFSELARNTWQRSIKYQRPIGKNKMSEMHLKVGMLRSIMKIARINENDL